MKRTLTAATLVVMMLVGLPWALPASELHFVASPTAPAVGAEFQVIIWVKDLRQAVAVDLRLAEDTLAVQLLDIAPAALRRFQWVRWKKDHAPYPSVTGLMLDPAAQGISFADGDTLLALRFRRLSPHATTLSLRTGYPVAMDSKQKELPCTVFPVVLGPVTAVEQPWPALEESFSAQCFPTPGRAGIELVVKGPQEPTPARWLIYDAMGRLVWSQTFTVVPGANRRVWPGIELSGQMLPTGTYFYRLSVGTREYKGKCVLLR